MVFLSVSVCRTVGTVVTGICQLPPPSPHSLELGGKWFLLLLTNEHPSSPTTVILQERAAFPGTSACGTESSHLSCRAGSGNSSDPGSPPGTQFQRGQGGLHCAQGGALRDLSEAWWIKRGLQSLL